MFSFKVLTVERQNIIYLMNIENHFLFIKLHFVDGVWLNVFNIVFEPPYI